MIDVLVIGGGFSGTLLAVNLVRHDGPPALLVERDRRPGAGIAYSTPSSSHLLNVRASNMSALPEDPGHFERWAGLECGATRNCFVPRVDYGRYLDSLLQGAEQAAAGKLDIRFAHAVGIAPDGDGYRVDMADGTHVNARRVVLATGNLPARAPPGLDPAMIGDIYANDPWQPGIAPQNAEAPVLLIGTGLTAIDACLLLRERGHQGLITAVSRGGLIPRVHGDPERVPPLADPPAPAPLPVLRHLRRQAEQLGWRAAIDQLRPHTRKLWRLMPHEERLRFLRHGRRWWDVHRHRMAPEVAAQIDDLQRSGQLRVMAGRIVDVRRDGAGAAVTISGRGGLEEIVDAARIINCTGPGDVRGSVDPLVQNLLRSGLVRPDALGMGLETDQQCRLVAANGEVLQDLFAVGPLTRGCFWEITAVPDIRHQVWTLARLLSNAHWVGGEGL